MQPASEHDLFRQRTGLAREVGEDDLGHILGTMDVTVHATKGCGINEVHITGDPFAEGGFRTVGSVAAQELSVLKHRSLKIDSRQTQESDKKAAATGQMPAGKYPVELRAAPGPKGR